ncbi:hypothetical protein KOM00_14075 [Geomonas sp. Red69]|uniref:Uncharacterized protein n=1 Tax=Geomonas diazotrophica TaxID=2843197 RepID=A0ABX8JFN7_9BACT|nr:MULTISPECIES: hypothetical protein [Geomonas]MBU5637853.1 hypothetical protein [Geomonas diazotrophica]QWV96568.1 hypothetical protein KP005_14480 [Geomonas nitrogeniifigens]
MGERDGKEEDAPVVVIVERRKQKETELSSTEVMKILRKRAARARKIPRVE